MLLLACNGFTLVLIGVLVVMSLSLSVQTLGQSLSTGMQQCSVLQHTAFTRRYKYSVCTIFHLCFTHQETRI